MTSNGPDRSAIGRRSKRKGSSYERHIVNTANPFLEPLGWKLQRTPRSGGWVAMSKDKEFSRLRSDITAPADFPLFLECKKRESWAMEQLFRVGLERWEPYLWFVEAREKAREAGKVPILIFARNQVPDLVFMDGGDFEALVKIPAREQVRVDNYVIALFSGFIREFSGRASNRRGSPCLSPQPQT